MEKVQEEKAIEEDTLDVPYTKAQYGSDVKVGTDTNFLTVRPVD